MSRQERSSRRHPRPPPPTPRQRSARHLRHRSRHSHSRGDRVSPRDYSEDELVERPTLDLLESLGYEIVDGYAETLGSEGLGRDDQSQVVLRHRLEPKLAELNPELPAAAIEAAVDELVLDRSALERTRANRGVHRLLRDGVTVTFADEEGGRSTETVRVVGWMEPADNEFLAVRQLWVVGPL